jgi:hypothetical protein
MRNRAIQEQCSSLALKPFFFITKNIRTCFNTHIPAGTARLNLEPQTQTGRFSSQNPNLKLKGGQPVHLKTLV